jgi:hypothetical protein
VRVACRRLHAEDAVGDLQDRDIERATAQVVHGHALAVFFFEAVRKRRCSRLVDDAANVEAGDLARGNRRGTLGVIEVRGDRHDRFDDLVAEE